MTSHNSRRRYTEIYAAAASLFGGAFLVLADALARNLFSPRQLPVGVLTALIGVPLFLILLNRSGSRK